MIGTSKKKSTLSDKIGGVLNTAPSSFDPEDDIYEETRAKVNENDSQESEEELPNTSKFRRQNLELLEDVDQRYVGKKGSRKSLQDEEEWTTEDEGLSTDEGEALDGISGTQDYPSDSEDDDNSSEDETDEEAEDSNEEFSGADSSPEDSNFKHISNTDVPSQVKKGNCVRNQLSIWESLLEMRIQLQKCLIASNKMPQYDVFPNFNEESFHSEAKKAKKNVKNVLDKFLTLQELLLKQYPETKSIFKESKEKKKESDEEIPSDTDEEMKSEDSEEEIPKKRKKISDFEQEIKTRHDKYADYRNSVIQKWNDKTRLTMAKNSGGANLLQHINFLLEDKPKLRKRTQMKRSDYEIIGKTKQEIPAEAEETDKHVSKLPEEYDTEIFDDDDFYHQLLRELIEYKSAGLTDPVQMSRQWIQLQNLRSKMKRKIDTRATKGRKIRYAVHSKLVNFMAPIDQNLWTEEAKNEMYSSLFGSKQSRQLNTIKLAKCESNCAPRVLYQHSVRNPWREVGSYLTGF